MDSIFILWLVLSLCLLVSTITLDNEVLGVPEIQCTEETINFKVTTRHPFRGNVYVRGQFGNPQCKQQYYNNNSPHVTFSIKIGECGMSRIRQLEPHGMNYMLVFVTNFHQSFVTKIDRAYNVRCFYAQADKIVHSELEVSHIQSQDLADSAMLMPKCEYSVHSQTIDGPMVRFVNVGDPIVHKWQCDNSVNYGMLVKNCVIKDDSGFTKQVLDEHGCPIYSPEIFGMPKYDSELKRAFVSTLAYKLPDIAQLRFECQIQVCNKRENECEGVSPPNCVSISPPDTSHNFVKPNVDPTPFTSAFDYFERRPTFIPSLKPDDKYPRYPERTVILQAHQQPYFRRKDSPTPTESNDITVDNLKDDWSFWRNSTPLILKRSSRSTTAFAKIYNDEKLNNRIRRAEDETLDVVRPLMVLDKDVDLHELYNDNDVVVDIKSEKLFNLKPICLDRTGLGILIGCFAFLSTCSLAMIAYILYDICIKRRKHRKGIITRRAQSECTDTESLRSTASKASNSANNHNNIILPRISLSAGSRVEPHRNIGFEKY